MLPTLRRNIRRMYMDKMQINESLRRDAVHKNISYRTKIRRRWRFWFGRIHEVCRSETEISHTRCYWYFERQWIRMMILMTLTILMMIMILTLINIQDKDEYTWKQHAELWSDFQVKWGQFWILWMCKILHSRYVMARNSDNKSVKKSCIVYDIWV